MTRPQAGGGGSEVLVVGAGLAGLAAAGRLAAAGCRVRLLERGTRAGGRAAVLEEEGRVVDPTAACIASTDAALLGLVHGAGLTGELLPLRPWVSAQVPATGSGAPRPLGDGSPLEVARIPGVRPLQALRLVRLPRLLARYSRYLDPDRPEAAAPLDDRSLADFGALYFGASVAERWMEPWLAERAPVDERDASRAAFLLRWWAERDASAGALREPPGLLAELLAARLPLHAGCRARSVEETGGGRVRVTAAGPQGEETLEADAVVLAIPADEALRVAAPLLARAEGDLLGGVRYEPALTWTARARLVPVSVATRVRLPRASGAPVSLVALEPERGAGNIGSARITAIARAAWSRDRIDAPADVIAKELAVVLERRLPIGIDLVDEGRVARFPAAWPRFDVGAYRALARLRSVSAERRHAGRRVYLAGDFLAAPTLEGAVRSGLRAAGDALDDLAGRGGDRTLLSRTALSLG
jgi:oxygen-dependent protoporphyrinogen oxidase